MPVCGWKQVGPENADHRRREHHRQQDHRGPEAVPSELSVDEERQTEADDDLENHRPAQEVRGRLQVLPDVLFVEDAFVVAQTDPLDVRIGPVCPEVREAEPDGPQQREDVDGEQNQDCRGDEEPDDGSVGETADLAGERVAGSGARCRRTATGYVGRPRAHPHFSGMQCPTRLRLGPTMPAVYSRECGRPSALRQTVCLRPGTSAGTGPERPPAGDDPGVAGGRRRCARPPVRA